MNVTMIDTWTTPIPALSLWQPWASLMAFGEKRIETRSWAPPKTLWGKDIAIHSAKVFGGRERELCLEWPFEDALRRNDVRLMGRLPLGAVVGVVTLVGAWPTEQVVAWERFPEFEPHFGDYTPGRCAWVTKNVRRLATPIPATGKQGIWLYDPARAAQEQERTLVQR